MSSEDVLLKKIQPTDCIIGFGVPITELAFSFAKFAKKHCNSCCASIVWKDYSEKFLPTEYITMIANLGVELVQLAADPTVVPRGSNDICATTVHEMFNRNKLVTIIFSHTDQSTQDIELIDCFKTNQQIVDQIPVEWSGRLLDLSTCYSYQLGQDIKNRFGESRVIRSEPGNVLTNPAVEISLFLLTFRILKDEPQCYVQAKIKALDLLNPNDAGRTTHQVGWMKVLSEAKL